MTYSLKKGVLCSACMLSGIELGVQLKKFRQRFLISLQSCGATSILQHLSSVKYTTLINDCLNKRKILLMKTLLMRQNENIRSMKRTRGLLAFTMDFSTC